MTRYIYYYMSNSSLQKRIPLLQPRYFLYSWGGN